MLKENTGIGLKKKHRLKRNADVEAEQKAAAEDKHLVKQEVEVKTKGDEEDDQMQIDTAQNQKQRKALQDDLRREKLDQYREQYDTRPEQLEKQKMAVDIFGESDEEAPTPMVKDLVPQDSIATEQQIEEIFNADDIDDPFSTAIDK